jgi:hypothetical protein
MASSTAARDRATRLAVEGDPSALELAREVQDPWFRSQTLAWVARYGPEVRLDQTLDEALRAATQATDPYQVVGASAWAVRAMVERGRMSRLGAAVGAVLHAARRIDHPVRRLDALFLVWHAAFPAGTGALQSVQEMLVQACQEARSWRAGRTMCDVALMLATDDLDAATSIVDSMRPGKHQRRATRHLGNGTRRPPRPFFWQKQSGPG